ncbi:MULTISPECIES: LolA family protein [Paracoccaceae]|jgi:outer membrane lipoprotein-sorting protein|uniref:LolA family protein n=1 Tax=Rhodobacterales TaxID=204455 RepID=UPI001D0A8BCB|nr:outer membrane lipoprotein carrier protein LolA [Boseongicola sp. H5]
MKRFLLSVALMTATALPAWAQAIPLSQLSAYLNSLQTAEGDFTQINADGSISNGTIYLHRPGRVRFEYGGDDDDLLVIAGGGQVAIFDGRSNSRPEQYPLQRTPLHLILAQNVDLGRSGMVVGHESDGTSTRVIAQDPENPEIGQITLVFTGSPVELRQWVITDETGSETTVILRGLETGGRMGARLFNIPQEIASRDFD